MEQRQVKLIERAKQEWEVTVDSLPQLICLLDEEKRLLRANRTVERWGLGQVLTVKGQDIHELIHAGCDGYDCYLTDFLNRVWDSLSQDNTDTCEVRDEALGRFLNIQLRALAPLPIDADEAASFAVIIFEDITAEKEAEAALQQQALELKARNAELDAFAHMVAHNLKNPLLPIISYAEILQSMHQQLPAETIEQDLETIARSGKKMNLIIEELLLLAGVRKLDVEPQPLEMGAIIAETQERLVYLIEQYDAEFVLPDSWPVAMGYAPWVEEVWANYISNGIRYGGRPPRLTLGATVLNGDQKMVRFWIQDNGSGLTPEEQSLLFTPFTQLSQLQVGGHGLGLSIVHRIVGKLGGQVSVESEGIPGRGAIFSFTLPQETK